MYRHEITEIAPHTWCLSEFRLVNAFLIEGEEKAALVDTGCGIGDLAGEVRALTDKPLIILLTHTHFDHDGGVFEFPGVPVYVNPLDGEHAEKITRIWKSSWAPQITTRCAGSIFSLVGLFAARIWIRKNC